jgi:protein-S-isoprenylcysteine O-methyltransferase Ste14
MSTLEEPFFWALISMFGLVGCCTVVGTKRIGGNPWAGLLLIAIFDLGRFVLPLSFCSQRRFDMQGMHSFVGGAIFLIGGVFGLGPSFEIKPLTVADENVTLRTTGFYGLVRNPIYLGEILLCLGWAVLHRSVIGVALVPLWWAGLLLLITIEEESLERALGAEYVAYKRKVRGRILPGLPI